MKEGKSKLQKFYAIISSVVFVVLGVGVTAALAAITFTATNFTSDGAMTVDASSTIAIGGTDGTIISIGRNGQTVRFLGVVSSSRIDTSGILSIGTSTAGNIIIGREGQFVSLPGVVSSSQIDATGNMEIGTSTATNIRIGRAGQFVSLQGNASTSGSFAISATGTPIIAHLSSSSVIGFGALIGATCQDTAVTSTGASVGDVVLIGAPAVGTSSVPSGLGWYGYVSSTDIVVIRGCNNLVSSTITTNSSTWRVDVWKH